MDQGLVFQTPAMGLPGVIAPVILGPALLASGIFWLRPGDTPSRFAIVALLLSLTWTFQQSLEATTDEITVRILFVNAAWVAFLSATDLLVVVKASREDLVGSTPTAQFLNAASLSCKWRRIGTKWEINNMPPRPSPPHTRLRSALHSLGGVVLTVMVVGALTTLPPKEDAVMVAPGRESLLTRLSDVTVDEIVFRAWRVPIYLATAIVGFIMFYNCVCLLAVVTGLSTPDECLPVFTSISNAYSIRQYWGTFYHQCIRRAISGPADYIVDNVLRLRRGTLFSRYSRLVLAFVFSGLLHHMGEISQEIPIRECGQFIFFSSQALGIMIEDAAIALYKRLPRGLMLPRFLEYAVGYAWVFLWFILVGPYWYFPQARYMP